MFLSKAELAEQIIRMAEDQYNRTIRRADRWKNYQHKELEKEKELSKIVEDRLRKEKHEQYDEVARLQEENEQLREQLRELNTGDRVVLTTVITNGVSYDAPEDEEEDQPM